MRRTCLALCAATLLVGASAGQQIPVDSLRAAWKDTTLATRQRVPALAQWMERDSMVTVQQAVLLVVPNGTDTNDARYVRQRGVAELARTAMYNHSNRTTKALPAAKEALRWVQRGRNVFDIALVHTYLGIQFEKIGLPGEAVQHQMLALEGYERLKDTLGQYNTNNDLATSYSTQNLSAQALAYYKRNLAMVRHREPYPVVDIMLRVAGEYKAMDDRTAAMAWLDSATSVIRNEGGTDTDRMVNWLRGDILMDDGDCAAALTELRLSMEAIDTNAGNPAGKSWIRSRIAMAHLCAKQYTAALQMASAGLAIAQEHDLLKEELDNLFPLASAYEGLGRAAEALRYFKRYHALSDSLINTETAGRLTDAALTLDFQKQQLADSLLTVQRERDAEVSLSKERARRNLLLIAGLVALVFGSISYRQRRKTQKALERSDELLLNILPEEVAEELKAKGHADAKHFDNVTILFTDFKGFTAMSEQVSARQLVYDLNECFSAFDRITEKHGIEKIKTIGDAYMAAGGLPTPNTTHALDVVKAALEIRDFIAEGKARKVAAGLPYFEIRIGIHTGPVVAGIVGVKKFAYDIWGDTVNTASRMESSGEVGQVNISESTYALVREQAGSQVHFTPRGKVQAKGKGAMEMYFVDLSGTTS